LDPEVLGKVKKFAPSIIHVWTPRNIPARVGWELKRRLGAKLIVDYEDDEDYLFWQGVTSFWKRFPIPSFLRPYLKPLQYLRMLHKSFVDPFSWRMGHPLFSLLINRAADAFTAISEPLKLCLERTYPRKPVYLLYPGADLNRFHPDVSGLEIREEYGLLDKKVIMYSGSINLSLFCSMLDAFEMVIRSYTDAVLVYTGDMIRREQMAEVIKDKRLDRKVIFTGAVAHKVMHRYLAMADVLLQPGELNSANEHRLPAKIPEYLAMGKPIVIFNCGVGKILEEGVEVLKHDGSPAQMAEKTIAVLADPALARKLGLNARKKAEELFNWEKNGRRLAQIYRKVCSCM
jgi:glycosyltransferase involved in cell wall biosynthesis